MKTVSVKVAKRDGVGKKSAKNLRKEGLVPGVIYGGKENVHFTVAPLDIRSIVYSGDFNIVEVDCDGQTQKCFLKDVQFHPVTDEIVHLDMVQMVDGHPMKIEVPIRFKGVAPGVKSGGKLVQKMRKAKIITTPENMIGELYVDVSEMGLGQSVRVRDIEAPDGIQVMNSPGTPVASIEIPRALRSAQSAADKAAGDDAES